MGTISAQLECRLRLLCKHSLHSSERDRAYPAGHYGLDLPGFKNLEGLNRLEPAHIHYFGGYADN